MKRVGFLGPPGTFTHEAVLEVYTTPEAIDLVFYGAIEEVLAAVGSGDVEHGMVPIENSVEGTVNATVDAIGFEFGDLVIEREAIIPVRLHLLAKPGTSPADVKEVLSMPHASAQCRRWLKTHAPDAKVVATNSTAEAAGWISSDPAGANRAAIGPNLAAQLYKLDVIARDVSDHPEAETRFVVVGREQLPATGRDKTSIVCFIAEDRPGALLEILKELADRNINLTKIESRPTKRVLGEYCFFMDMEGHRDDPVIAEGLEGMAAHVSKLRVLGSYPRAIGQLDKERLMRRASAANVRPGG